MSKISISINDKGNDLPDWKYPCSWDEALNYYISSDFIKDFKKATKAKTEEEIKKVKEKVKEVIGELMAEIGGFIVDIIELIL